MASYHERIGAPWWLWVLGALWASTLGVAYGAAISRLVGLIVGVSLFAAVGVALVRTALVIEVKDRALLVGRARLVADLIAQPEVLDAESASRRRGPDADGRAFVALRGWVKTAVVVPVVDPLDPTPYWFVSTRRPEALAAAITSARDAGGSTVTGSAHE